MDYNSESKKVFETMTGLLGLETVVKKQEENNGKIILNVATEQPGRLIGRNGHALNNLSMLMNRMLRRKHEDFPSIIVDVESDGKKPQRERKPRTERPRKDRKKGPKAETAETAEEVIGAAPADVKVEASTTPVEKVQKTEQKVEKVEVATAPAVKTEAPAVKTEKVESEQKAEKSENSVEKVEKTEKPQPEKKTEKPSAPKKEKKAASKLEMQCRNAVKEVKRWGDDALLPPMAEAECFKAIDILKADGDVVAVIDEKNHGNRKRVRLSLKND